jgi:drug/metabolite transporter (DMT)-like permease
MKIKGFLAVLILALLWGPAFLFVKVAVQEIPPLTIVATRVSVGALVLLGLLRYQKGQLPRTRSAWGHLAIVALTFNALPYTLLSWGQQYIDSALAAILVGTTPLFTLLLADFLTDDDHLTLSKTAGALLGFGGLVLLVAPSLLGGVRSTGLGLLAATAAAASYAVGMVYGHAHLRDLPPLAGPTTQMLLAAFFLVPLSLVAEHPYTLVLPSLPALASLLMLSFFSTVLAFVVYYRAQETTNATTLSMVTYINPIIATILGVLVLGERPSEVAYVSSALILVGVLITNGVYQSNVWHRLAALISEGFRPRDRRIAGEC